MATPTLGFLQQPIQLMAQEGEAFSQTILKVLRAWMQSTSQDSAQAARNNRLYVLSDSPKSDWQIVVMRPDRAHSAPPSVCFIEYGDTDKVAERFAPLINTRWIPAKVEIELSTAQSGVFALLWDLVGESPSGMHVIDTKHHLSQRFDGVFNFDNAARRWASSRARDHFKELLDEAVLQPQIVNRGRGDDVVVVSRHYLEELVDPSSARAMSAHFRGRGLSAEGLEVLDFGELEDLADLPQLPNA